MGRALSCYPEQGLGGAMGLRGDGPEPLLCILLVEMHVIVHMRHIIQYLYSIKHAIVI